MADQDVRQLPTDVAQAEDRDSGYDRQGFEQQRDLAAATLATVLGLRLVGEVEVSDSAATARPTINSRARRIATSSRSPPPTEPQVSSSVITILAPGARGV